MDSIDEKLRKIIDPERISTNAEYLDELSWDALSEGRFHPRHQPALVPPVCAVAPVSTAEVQQLVRFANREKLPIVPFGGVVSLTKYLATLWAEKGVRVNALTPGGIF